MAPGVAHRQSAMRGGVLSKNSVRLGLVLAICGFVVWQALAQQPPVADAPGTLPKGWREYKPKDSSYMVWMPQRGGVQHQHEYTLRLPNSAPLVLYTVAYQPATGPVFIAGIVQVPMRVANNIQGTDWMDLVRDAFLKEDKAKLIDFKEIARGKVPGKEYVIKGPKDTTRLRVYAEKATVYVVAVQGTPAEAIGAESVTFFDSYQSARLPAEAMPVVESKEKPKEKEKPQGPSLDTAVLAGLLQDLKSSDAKARQGAAEKLATVEPGERRAEVAKALAALLGDTNVFVLRSAKKAFVVWGSVENVPEVLPLLSNDSSLVRHNAMEVLAVFKDERGAEAVAMRLEKSADRSKASETLRRMGPVAEQAALKRLKSLLWEVRLEACQILQAVGSKASMAGLQAAASDRNPRVAAAAKDAAAAMDRK